MNPQEEKKEKNPCSADSKSDCGLCIEPPADDIRRCRGYCISTQKRCNKLRMKYENSLYESNCSSHTRIDMKHHKKRTGPNNTFRLQPGLWPSDEVFQPYDPYSPYSKLPFDSNPRLTTTNTPYTCTAYCSESGVRCVRRSTMSNRSGLVREATCEAHCLASERTWIKQPVFRFQTQLEKCLNFHKTTLSVDRPRGLNTPSRLIFDILGIDQKMVIAGDIDSPYGVAAKSLLECSSEDAQEKFLYRIITQQEQYSLLILLNAKQSKFLIYDPNSPDSTSLDSSVSAVQSALMSKSLKGLVDVEWYLDRSDLDIDTKQRSVFLILLVLSELNTISKHSKYFDVGATELGQITKQKEKLVKMYESFCVCIDRMFTETIHLSIDVSKTWKDSMEDDDALDFSNGEMKLLSRALVRIQNMNEIEFDVSMDEWRIDLQKHESMTVTGIPNSPVITLLFDGTAELKIDAKFEPTSRNAVIDSREHKLPADSTVVAVLNSRTRNMQVNPNEAALGFSSRSVEHVLSPSCFPVSVAMTQSQVGRMCVIAYNSTPTEEPDGASNKDARLLILENGRPVREIRLGGDVYASAVVLHDSKIYVSCHTHHFYGSLQASCIKVFDLYSVGQEPLHTISEQGEDKNQLNCPEGIAIADDLIYVADSDNHRIQVFNLEGDHIRSWGSQGSETGKFDNPVGVFVHEEHVYVTDRDNFRVQVFKTEGKFVREWSILEDEDDEPSDTLDISGIVVHGKLVYVTERGNQKIKVYQLNGSFVFKKPLLDSVVTVTGEYYPHGICVYGGGFFVCVGNHVFKFR